MFFNSIANMCLLFRIVLYCIVLYCIVLYCIVLYCIVLYCIVLYCIVLIYLFAYLLCDVFVNLGALYFTVSVFSCTCSVFTVYQPKNVLVI